VKKSVPLGIFTQKSEFIICYSDYPLRRYRLTE
jgi:hypothetical protein